MYATLQEGKGRLKGFFEQLYADETAQGGVNEADALIDLEAAAAEIDGSAAVRYVTPVTAVASQPLLKNWELTIFEELAWRRNAQGKTPENVKDRVKEVRKQLERLAKKELVLKGAAELSGSSSIGGAVIVSSTKPVFKREQMSGF